MVKRYDTGTAGKLWIEERLRAGLTQPNAWMPVAAALKQNATLTMGTIRAVLDTPPVSAASDLSAGGGRRLTPVIDALAEWVHDFVRSDPDHACLVDESMSRIGDPAWERWADTGYRDAVLRLDQAIMYRVTHGNDSRDRIRAILVQAYQIGSFCFALTRDRTRALGAYPAQSEISFDVVLRVLGEPQGLAVDAYDGEGAVIWMVKPMPDDPS